MQALANTIPKMLLIGLDGADWRVMRPMIERGELPTLARLAEEGVRGDLRSFEPLASPLVWTSIATGKVPDKHGIRDFFSTQTALRAKRIWDIVHEERPTARIGLYKYLFTWPPVSNFTFVVPGWTARSPETTPPYLRFVKEIEMAGLPGTSTSLAAYARVGFHGLVHGMHLSTLLRCALLALYERLKKPANLELHYRKHLLDASIECDVYSRLLRLHRPEFSASIYTGMDGISHHYWKYYEPEPFGDVEPGERQRYGDVIPRCYRAADRIVNCLLESTEEETNVLVVSDHGFRANPNRWVMRQLNVGLMLERLHISHKVYVSIILDKIHLRMRSGHGGERGAVVEMLRSLEYCGDHGPFLEIECAADASTIAVRPRRLAETGDEVSVLIEGEEVPLHQLLIEKAEISGTHDPIGVLIGQGPGLRRNADIGEVSVLDVGPTILALMALPVGRDMDGRVLTEAIDPAFLRSHPVRLVETHEERQSSIREPEDVEDFSVAESIVGERLRALGYIE
jgi:hypothetical protein